MVDESVDPLDMPFSCAVDVALGGDKTLNEVAMLMGQITRERVRQIESKSICKFRDAVDEIIDQADLIDLLWEIEFLRSERDTTIWSSPDLDGRVSGSSIGKAVAAARKRIVPDHLRQYHP